MRIVILAPVRLLGEGLEAYLRTSANLVVAGVAADFRTLRIYCAEREADLALIDVTVGIDFDDVRALATERPALRLVALGLAEQRAQVVRCAKAGFCAYIARDTPLAELEPLLLEAAQGRSRCPAEIVAGLMRALFRPDLDPAPAICVLTRREGEVLRLIGRGQSNKEIARELALSGATVKNHVHNLLAKLRLSRRNEAMRRVRDEPWLAGPAPVPAPITGRGTSGRGSEPFDDRRMSPRAPNLSSGGL